MNSVTLSLSKGVERLSKAVFSRQPLAGDGYFKASGFVPNKGLVEGHLNKIV
jgi:hypothetical protein